MSSFSSTFTIHYRHHVEFTRGVFSLENPVLSNIMEQPGETKRGKALVTLDLGLSVAMPGLEKQVIAHFSQPSFPVRLACDPLWIPGGELVKNSSSTNHFYKGIEKLRLCRHSYIIAVGGGASLDVVGFAAATAHRGIRHIRIPTTTLSQADSGVGVKNGINAFGKKNFIGTFAPPFAVINDSDFLFTLGAENRKDGLIEAIKVALIRDSFFFAEIENMAELLVRFERASVERVVYRSAELHYLHITKSGDPFEMQSARPLDFGHWAAHKLEQLSEFKLSHGKAVAIGLVLDVLYSEKMGSLSRSDSQRIINLIRKLGFPLFDALLKEIDSKGKWLILEGLEDFREHLGGELTVTLLDGIGRGIEVHEMDPEMIKASILEMEKLA